MKYYRVQGINQLFHHSSVSRGIPGVTGAHVLRERSDQRSTVVRRSKAVSVNNWETIYKSNLVDQTAGVIFWLLLSPNLLLDALIDSVETNCLIFLKEAFSLLLKSTWNNVCNYFTFVMCHNPSKTGHPVKKKKRFYPLEDTSVIEKNRCSNNFHWKIAKFN